MHENELNNMKGGGEALYVLDCVASAAVSDRALDANQACARKNSWMSWSRNGGGQYLPPQSIGHLLVISQEKNGNAGANHGLVLAADGD